MISKDLKIGMWLYEINPINIAGTFTDFVGFQVASLNKKDNKVKLNRYEIIHGDSKTVLIIHTQINLNYSSFALIEPMGIKEKRDFIDKIFNVISVTKL